MTQQEQLIKLILPDFLAYLDMLKNGIITDKGLDNSSNPSINGDEEEEGVE